jgi:hypothetical protein
MPWTRLGNQCWAVIREWRHTPEDYHGGAYNPTVIMAVLTTQGYHGDAYNPMVIMVVLATQFLHNHVHENLEKLKNGS